MSYHERFFEMSNTLSVRLSSHKTGEESWFEGTVSIVGLKPTKLARRSDGNTRFPTKSAVSGAARNLAKSLGFSDISVVDSESKKAKPKACAGVKTACKRSVKQPASQVVSKK